MYHNAHFPHHLAFPSTMTQKRIFQFRRSDTNETKQSNISSAIFW